MKNARLLIAASCLFLLVGCGTPEGVLLPDQPFSLNEIRQSISNLCGGTIRAASENNREIWSPFFSRKEGDSKFDPKLSKERAYAHFWILGERRPYDVKVQVILEKRKGERYVSVGELPSLSKKIAKELEQKLNESPDRRNAIDDFRPY